MKYRAERYSRLYHTEEEFRAAEKARKAKWYQENRDRLIKKILDARANAKKVKV